MALGKRQEEQQEMWVATTSLPKSEGHVFYRKLNEVLNLSEAGIDVEIEEAVADKGYHATDTLDLADWLGVRTYIPERKTQGKGMRNWEGVPEEKPVRFSTIGVARGGRR